MTAALEALGQVCAVLLIVLAFAIAVIGHPKL